MCRWLKWWIEAGYVSYSYHTITYTWWWWWLGKKGVDCWIIEVGHPASQAVVVQQTGVPKMHLRGKCTLQLSHMEINVPWNWCQKTFHFDCREQMELRGIFSPHSLGNCEGIGKLVSAALGKYFGLFLWKIFFDCTANYCYQRLSTVWCTEGPEM